MLHPNRAAIAELFDMVILSSKRELSIWRSQTANRTVDRYMLPRTASSQEPGRKGDGAFGIWSSFARD